MLSKRGHAIGRRKKRNQETLDSEKPTSEINCDLCAVMSPLSLTVKETVTPQNDSSSTTSTSKDSLGNYLL